MENLKTAWIFVSSVNFETIDEHSMNDSSKDKEEMDRLIRHRAQFKTVGK